jgi:predicted dehydrogenase
MRRLKAGIIGCGNISGIYLENCTKHFKVLEIEAVADLIPERARAKAEEYGVPRALSVEEMLGDPQIEMVINLTVPAMHGDLCLKALEAGKHVYIEKPLSIKRETGAKVLEAARLKGLRVGGAPDTFLGGGLQTCRKLIDEGWIGRPVAAAAFMTGHGPEGWHPDPEFFYKEGGGPLLDMGPYYLTTLVALMGPVRRISGSAAVSFPERQITSKEKYGTMIKVDVPTHVSAALDFESGVVATLVTSFDVWDSKLPRIEIYGSLGTMSLPDPNYFNGPVLIKRHDAQVWSEMPLAFGYTDNMRGIGAADMAAAIIGGRPHRANGDMTFHVLDIMQGIIESSEQGRHYAAVSTCSRPEALDAGFGSEVGSI